MASVPPWDPDGKSIQTFYILIPLKAAGLLIWTEIFNRPVNLSYPIRFTFSGLATLAKHSFEQGKQSEKRNQGDKLQDHRTERKRKGPLLQHPSLADSEGAFRGP